MLSKSKTYYRMGWERFCFFSRVFTLIFAPIFDEVIFPMFYKVGRHFLNLNKYTRLWNTRNVDDLLLKFLKCVTRDLLHRQKYLGNVSNKFAFSHHPEKSSPSPLNCAKIQFRFLLMFIWFDILGIPFRVIPYFA